MVRNSHEPTCLGDHHFGITTIGRSPRNGLILAIDEVATATVFAIPAMATHITHAHSLSFFPTMHTGPSGFDFSDHFMARNARVCWSRKNPFNRKSIGVANATGLDTNSDLPEIGLDD